MSSNLLVAADQGQQAWPKPIDRAGTCCSACRAPLVLVTFEGDSSVGLADFDDWACVSSVCRPEPASTTFDGGF